MASKKSTTKHYPVVRQMPLSEASPHANKHTRVVDCGRILSQANRRLYRQGRYYKAKIDLDADSATKFEVFALRDDWAIQKGFQLAYDMYLKNSAEEMEALGQNRMARWEDFRVYYGLPTGAFVLVGPQFTPNGITDHELVLQGEFQDTQVTIADGTEKRFTFADTGSASQYSILEEYDKVGNAQGTPNSLVGSAVAYDDIETQMDAAQAANLETKGNLPPYDQNGVNANGPFVKVATLNAANPEASKLSTGFFTAPCGIVLIKQEAASDIRGKYSLTVAAGDYKGVHAPSMLE
mgnify:CR=1 FL=1